MTCSLRRTEPLPRLRRSGKLDHLDCTGRDRQHMILKKQRRERSHPSISRVLLARASAAMTAVYGGPAFAFDYDGSGK